MRRWRRAPNHIPSSAGDFSASPAGLGGFLRPSCVCPGRDFPYDLVANVLVSLAMKDTRTALRFLLGSEEVER